MLQDGRIFVAGGEEGYMPWTHDWGVQAGWDEENLLQEGRWAVRSFDYRDEAWTDWKENLTAPHW